MSTITTILSTDIIGNSRATINTNFSNLNTDKAELASPTFTGTVTSPALILSSETASTIASLDASKNIKSLALATYPSLTELSYVKGLTSAVQTQINTKAPSTAPTFATSITGSYLTASEILGTDGSKNIVSLAVATYPSLTELSYVKGLTSSIQTQINSLSTFNLQRQIVRIPNGQSTLGDTYFTTSYLGASTSNAIYSCSGGSLGGQAPTLSRFIKLNNGSLILTHSVVMGVGADNQCFGIAVIGSYVYSVTAAGGAPRLFRYAIADLTGETEITISGTALTVATNIFSDGVDLYNVYTAGTAKKYTISGTTATSGADTSFTSMVTTNTHWSDGTYVYGITPTACFRWAIAGGARTSGTSLIASQYTLSGTTQTDGGGIFKEVGNSTHIQTIFVNKTANFVTGILVPVTTF